MILVSVLIRTSLRAYGYVVNEKKLLIVSNERVTILWGHVLPFLEIEEIGWIELG